MCVYVVMFVCNLIFHLLSDCIIYILIIILWDVYVYIYIRIECILIYIYTSSGYNLSRAK